LTALNYYLQLDSLTKRYDRHLAVDKATLHIPKGKIYGLLGPNGAGKTTIIRMITGIIIPDEGSMIVEGRPWDRDDTLKIGYMPEERGLYKKMKVGEQITYLLELKGKSRTEAQKLALDWLEKLELSDWKNHKASELSKGMQQKVQFIATIAHQPKLLILDEPFSGLDPVNTQVIEREIRDMQNRGTTIIFSTHRMEQVEELCDHIALVNKGKVILEDEILNVRKQFQRDIYHLEYEGTQRELDTLSGMTVNKVGEGKALLTLHADTTHKMLLRQLSEISINVLSISLHMPRLNEIFIELVSGKTPQELFA